MPDKTNENELYIPKVGERVRVTAVDPEDRDPQAQVGDEFTVGCALESNNHPGFICCGASELARNGTYCRVEPIADQLARADGIQVFAWNPPAPAEETDSAWLLRTVRELTTENVVVKEISGGWHLAKGDGRQHAFNLKAIARDRDVIESALIANDWPMRATPEQAADKPAPPPEPVKAEPKLCDCGVELVGKFAAGDDCGECLLARDVRWNAMEAYGHGERRPAAPAPEKPHDWESEVATAGWEGR